MLRGGVHRVLCVCGNAYLGTVEAQRRQKTSSSPVPTSSHFPLLERRQRADILAGREGSERGRRRYGNRRGRSRYRRAVVDPLLSGDCKAPERREVVGGTDPPARVGAVVVAGAADGVCGGS